MATDVGKEPRRFGRATKWAIAVGIILTILSIAGASMAYAGLNYSHRYEGHILPGSTIDGTRVGGLTRKEALQKVRATVRPALTRRIHVTWHNKTWTVTPKELGAKSDARAAVEAAMSRSAQQSFAEKLRMRLFHRGLGFHRGVAITYPKQGVRGFVHGISSGFDTDPLDAKLDYSTGWVKIFPEHTGRTVRVDLMQHRIMKALRTGSSHVSLAARKLEPSVRSDAFQKVLLVRIGENKLYLYENGEITHTYTVATGRQEFPTPQGQFEVVNKRYMPTWVNPDPKGWGSSMPASIAPGADNPLGLRAIDWSASGIRFHGVPTSELSTLGYNASHGCIRMSNADAIGLFDLVDVGTPIVSIQVAPYKPLV